MLTSVVRGPVHEAQGPSDQQRPAVALKEWVCLVRARAAKRECNMMFFVWPLQPEGVDIETHSRHMSHSLTSQRGSPLGAS
jgi:hypothetical protein